MAAIVVAAAVTIIHSPVRLGLDLRGGASMIVRVKVEDASASQQREIVEQTRQILERRINALDPMAEELLQWKSAEVAGKGFSQALGITDREGTRLPDASESADLVLLPPARRDPPILSFRRKDGSRVLCEVRTAQVRDDLGEVVEVVCALWRTTQEGDLDRAFGNPLSRRVLNAAP